MAEEQTAPANWRANLLNPAVLLTMAAVAVAVAIGIALVFRFVDQERKRDLNNWQVRLRIETDSRKAAIDSWLSRQWSVLGGIADNETVRILLTELRQSSGDLKNVPDGQSQVDYVGNFLTLAAVQNQFVSTMTAPNLPVNIDRAGTAGLAIFDVSGRLVVATRGTPLAEPSLGTLLADATKGKRSLRDVYNDAAANPAMGFLIPIFAEQAVAIPDQQVGWVMGVKEPGPELYPLLRQPGDLERSGTALLLRRTGTNVEILSPLPDFKPLALVLAAGTPGLAEAEALRSPDSFGLAQDYRGREVLFMSRPIDDAPWVLMYKVDRAEALADTDRRGVRLLLNFMLVILVTLATFAAVWRHGASHRAALSARRFRTLAAQFEDQANLLRVVTDGQPNSIFIADEAGRYIFANRHAALQAGISSENMLGKSLEAVMGPAKAHRYLELNRRASETKQIVDDLARSEDAAAITVLHSQHIPLEAGPDRDRGVLVIEEDLSAVTAEQERRRSTLDHLVQCLISIADRRNPAAAGHSGFVAEVARAAAEEMGFDPVLADTAEMAGRLMNLGKILVPASILTRAGPLTKEELDRLHDAMLEATRLLEGVEFDGPVIDTLRQCQEHWDGGGRPNGLKEREIIPTARVLAVANAFVGLRSPRSYRAPMGMDNAMRILIGEIGMKFDPAVVAALVSHIENKGGRAAWADLPARPGRAGAAVIDPP